MALRFRSRSPQSPVVAFPPVIVDPDPDKIEGSYAPFGFHLGHDIFGRSPKPDLAADRINARRLADSIRDVMLALICRPDLLGSFRVALSPGIHSDLCPFLQPFALCLVPCHAALTDWIWLFYNGWLTIDSP
jgi:hypothetical protein